MANGTIYFIHRPSPTLGRSPLQGGHFPHSMTENFITGLQNDLKRRGLPWTVQEDDTESDIDVLIARNVDLLICAPGLRFQFYHQGFNKQNIIWLSVTEFAAIDTTAIIRRLKESGLVSA